MSLTTHIPRTLLFALALGLGVPSAFAQDDKPAPEPAADEDRQKPNEIGQGSYKLDFVDKSLYDFTTWVADLKRMNFVIGDPKELQSKKVTIISHKPVPLNAVFEAYLAALEVNGFTLSVSGNNAKIVKSSEAGQSPIQVGRGSDIPASDRIVTQLIPLENISVSDVNSIVTSMASPGAKVIAYQPANTLIITDVAHNLRKVYEVLADLDVAAPKSTLEIVPVLYADAAEIKDLIEELYGTAESTPATSTPASRRTRRPAARTPEPAKTESATAGDKAKYIDKVLSDERTNSLIVLANEVGHQTVRDLLAKLDVDETGLNESRIYVVRLENAKAEEVASVLSELSQAGSGSSQNNARGGAAANARNARNQRNQPAAPAEESADGGGAIAAFDSGMRIASDENTNSLVIIAKPQDYEVVKSVIDKLDIERRQVFVDATILEISSEDTFELGLAAHLPTQPGRDATGFVGGQFNASSLGLSTDALSGLAVGVFGPLVSIPTGNPLAPTLDVPAFGIVLNALRSNQSVSIVSNPTLMMLDNEEAKIVVGRKVPFPTQISGLGAQFGGIPIQSFQREDVAITMEITPRVNSSNNVTLEISVEVQEIEEDDSGLSAQGGGPVTSQRKVETVVLVGDNQTAVLGGLVANTATQVETKFPVLGDLPLLGALFRGKRDVERKTNLMIFLTPHIIDDSEDIVEVQRVKEAQRQEFLRRFYGRSREKQMQELRKLMQYSMNFVDEPSVWRGPTVIPSEWEDSGEPLDDQTRKAIEDALNEVDGGSPTDGLAVPAEENP
ncbi:MAG: type II secretion system secretin GspD [Alphaproteobacteria bacterium]|nr:type II secretion system secretin GspD [Alphaproteobacteria bacterium]